MHCSVPNGQSPTLMLNRPLLSTEVLEDTSVARFVNIWTLLFSLCIGECWYRCMRLKSVVVCQALYAVSSNLQHSGSFYSTKKCATSEWFTFIQWYSYFVHKFHKHRVGVISQCGISVKNFIFLYWIIQMNNCKMYWSFAFSSWLLKLFHN